MSDGKGSEDHSKDKIQSGDPVVPINDPHYQNLEFSISESSGTGNGIIRVSLKGVNGGTAADRPAFPTNIIISANNIKTRKRLVIRVNGNIVLTIPVEYIPRT